MPVFSLSPAGDAIWEVVETWGGKTQGEEGPWGALLYLAP